MTGSKHPDARSFLQEEVFNWQGLRLQQWDTVHKIGTDTVLLGGWVQEIIPSAKVILDVGTGTGALAIFLGRHFSEARIHGMDIHDEAVALAKINVLNTNFADRVSITHGNIINGQPDDLGLADLIVSNPPYYQTDVKSPDAARAQARHLDDDAGTWMNAFNTLANAGGHICLVLPHQHILTWIAAANDHGWFVTHKANVFSFAYDALPKRALLHFTRELKSPVFTRINIYADDKAYSREFLTLTGIEPARSSNSFPTLEH